MGSKHPLDVFRSSGDGFKGATRKRRTVPGRVIASSSRESPGFRPKTLPLSAGRPKKKTLLGQRSGQGLSRNLFYGAVALVAVVALVIVFQQTWHDEGGEALPTMKMSEALPGPPQPPETTAAPEWFTILAATYAGSENGERLATLAQARLHQRLYRDVMVIGYPEPGEPGQFKSYAVLVGKEAAAAELEGELERLRAIDDWQGGKAAPFVSARIVAHPHPDF